MYDAVTLCEWVACPGGAQLSYNQLLLTQIERVKQLSETIPPLYIGPLLMSGLCWISNTFVPSTRSRRD